MAELVLPPHFRPTEVGDGTTLAMPTRLPRNFFPTACPTPEDPRSRAAQEDVEHVFQQFMGREPWNFGGGDMHIDERPEQSAGPSLAGPETSDFDDADSAETDPVAQEQYRHPAFDPLSGELLFMTVDGSPRYLNQTPRDGGNIATNAAGDPLFVLNADGTKECDDDGEPVLIWVDADGFECSRPDGTSENEAPATGWRKYLNLLGSNGRTTAEQEQNVQAYDAEGIPIEDFSVVKAGSIISDSNSKRGKRILLGIGGVVLLVGGASLAFGVVMGSSRVPAEGAISGAEIEKYQLSDFPVNETSAFATNYLRTCLTHGDKQQVAKREELLNSMASPNASDQCGWTSGGSTQEPKSIVFNGDVRPIDGFSSGRAAYLGYSVAMDDSTMTVSVPVWVGPAEGGGQAMQVVGDIGIDAPTPSGTAPDRRPNQNTDNNLGAELNSQLLAPFFTAWGASDTQQLNLVLSSHAGPNARGGLNGTVTRPEIESVTAISPKATSSGDSPTYVDGDTAILETGLTWQVVSSDSTQYAGYRVHVVMESGQWRIADVESGLLSSASNGSNKRVGEDGYTDTTDSGSDSSTSASSDIGGADELQSGSSGSGDGSGSDLPSMPDTSGESKPPTP